MVTHSDRAITVWRFTDGKAGHEKQTQALVEGLASYRDIKLHDISLSEIHQINRALLFGTWPELTHLEKPDIALGAGHATHLAILAAKRAYQAKAVVVMNPSAPAFLFDAIITPAHDGYSKKGNRIVTPTALAPSVNSMPQAEKGLILLGGINNHFQWPEQATLQLISQLISKRPKLHWQISNSRRTPHSTTTAVENLCKQNNQCTFIDCNDSPANWLANELRSTSEIWITVDSVSMVSEALNTKAGVGIIDLPPTNPKKANKIQRTIANIRSVEPLGEISTNNYVEPKPRSQPANHHIKAAEDILILLNL